MFFSTVPENYIVHVAPKLFFFSLCIITNASVIAVTDTAAFTGETNKHKHITAVHNFSLVENSTINET